METVVKNLVYQSTKPFLSEEEVQGFEEILKTKNADYISLGVDHKITKEWSDRIMSLPLPDWIDSKGGLTIRNQ